MLLCVVLEISLYLVGNQNKSHHLLTSKLRLYEEIAWGPHALQSPYLPDACEMTELSVWTNYFCLFINMFVTL